MILSPAAVFLLSTVLPTLGLASSSSSSSSKKGSSSTGSADWISIRQTLNLYPLAIDSKDFGLLSEVFASDAVADYNVGLGTLTGLSGIQTGLTASLSTVNTQHALSTQIIDIAQNGSSANSTTYFTASHFPLNWTVGGLIQEGLYAYGKYLDVLVKTEESKKEEGTWRVKHRELVYLGPLVGNLSIFSG